ncbi:MAG TPA: choice-of-anchor Q domain-containing protein, partial [Rhodanobacteraceae bacterium]
QGNAGNQVKISGPSSIVNSIIVGSCMWTQQKSGTTMLGTMQSADDCRALGNAVEVDFPLSNQLATLAFNTITGQGDGLVDASQTGHGNKVVLANNILDGRRSDKRGDEATFGYYGGDDNPVAVGWIGNLVHGIRHGNCPADSICRDPMLRDPSFGSYDPAPRSGSPAIAAAAAKVNVGTDFRGKPRPARASIGAMEYPTSFDGAQPRP